MWYTNLDNKKRQKNTFSKDICIVWLKNMYYINNKVICLTLCQVGFSTSHLFLRCLKLFRNSKTQEITEWYPIIYCLCMLISQLRTDCVKHLTELNSRLPERKKCFVLLGLLIGITKQKLNITLQSYWRIWI